MLAKLFIFNLEPQKQYKVTPNYGTIFVVIRNERNMKPIYFFIDMKVKKLLMQDDDGGASRLRI